MGFSLLRIILPSHPTYRVVSLMTSWALAFLYLDRSLPNWILIIQVWYISTGRHQKLVITGTELYSWQLPEEVDRFLQNCLCTPICLALIFLHFCELLYLIPINAIYCWTLIQKYKLDTIKDLVQWEKAYKLFLLGVVDEGSQYWFNFHILF